MAVNNRTAEALDTPSQGVARLTPSEVWLASCGRCGPSTTMRRATPRYQIGRAHARHQAWHFLKWTAFAQLFKAAKFGDVEARRMYLARVVEFNRNLGVTFDACDRLNQNAAAHAPNFRPFVGRASPANRLSRNWWMVSAEGGQPGRKWSTATTS